MDRKLEEKVSTVQVDGFPDDMPEPSEAELERIRLCDAWFEESESWMAQKRARWRLNEDLVNNRVDVPGPKGGVKIRVPIVHSICQTILGIISDNLPGADVMPADRNDEFFSGMMQKRLDQVLLDGSYREEVIAVIEKYLGLGDGLCSIYPRHEGDEYDSGVDFSWVSNYTWFPSPGFRGMDIRSEARYHIFATPMHLDEIYREYGVVAKAEGTLDEYGEFNFLSADGSGEKTGDMALVKECFAYDIDEDRYPEGRVTLYVGEYILHDGPVDGRIPYFKLGNYQSKFSGFGVGEPELIKYMVKALNHIMSSIADKVNKAGNPIEKVTQWFVNNAKKAAAHVAGDRVVVREPGDFTYEVPPNVSSDSFSLLELILRLIDVSTGVHDVTQGKKPAGVTAASAIYELQEAAQTRIRQKIDNEISAFIRETAEYTVWLLKRYDRETIRIRHKTESGELSFTPYDPLGIYDADGRPFGDSEFDVNTMQTLGDSRLDIEIVAGRHKATNRAERENRFLTLFEKGVVQIEDLIMALDIPNKKGVIDSYYRARGLEELRKKQEALYAAFQDFERLVGEALARPEPEWLGSPEEQELMRLVSTHTEFLNTGEWEALPADYRDRLLVIFAQETQELEGRV